MAGPASYRLAPTTAQRPVRRRAALQVSVALWGMRQSRRARTSPSPNLTWRRIGSARPYELEDGVLALASRRDASPRAGATAAMLVQIIMFPVFGFTVTFRQN